ncbi:MAG: 30S ribosome-binding factor RbfA [Steroidobacteraceae bacterium]
MTGNARAARVASQMQRALAALLRRGVKDPRVGNVTVTRLDVSTDLTVARVYVLPFATSDAHAAEQMLAGLHSAGGFLRGQLARELKLRHAPQLEFALDVEIERAHHLTELIERAVAGDTRGAEADRSAGELDSDKEEQHEK